MSAKFYDTLLGEYVKNPGIRGIGLDKLASKELNYKMISYDEMTAKGKISFDKVNINAAANYSGEDVYITNEIYKIQEKEKTTEIKILNEIEIPLIEVLKKIEIDGVKVDRDKLKGIGLLLEKEIENLEKEIFAITEEQFNIKSPKQVGEILFDKLGLPKGKKTKTGWSVSAEVLGELSHQYEIVQKIVDYRHYTKLLSTYIEGLSDLLDEDDFLHTSYNQAVTATGRLSSTNPNLQNIPSSEGIAGEIRGAFISRFENGKILAIDYSQVELRILAITSGDTNLLNAFKTGEDIHHKTAQFLFPGETITNSKRKIAKAVNFGVIYGISSFGLSKMVGIGVKEAKIYIEKFFESYPKVKQYIENTIKSCEENKYVETHFGRRRFINGINDSNKIIKSSAEREAINMPIQGTNADIIKIAMIKTSKFLEENNLKTHMIMQVHDELVFDIYPGEEKTVEENVVNILENILTGKEIPLIAEAKIGESWRETK